jgi:hypothetical protein
MAAVVGSPSPPSPKIGLAAADRPIYSQQEWWSSTDTVAIGTFVWA